MTTTLSIRMDEDLKADAEEFFSDIGMNLTTAITVFFRQAVRENRIPFTVTRDRPTRETAAAMRAALGISQDPNSRGFQNTEELLRFLKG